MTTQHSAAAVAYFGNKMSHNLKKSYDRQVWLNVQTEACQLCSQRQNLKAKGFNLLIATLKPQSNGPLYSNTVISTLAVDGWAVTFGTRGGGTGRGRSPPRPSSLYQM